MNKKVTTQDGTQQEQAEDLEGSEEIDAVIYEIDIIESEDEDREEERRGQRRPM